MPQSEISKPADQSATDQSRVIKGIEISALVSLFVRKTSGALEWISTDSAAFIVGASALLAYASARLVIDIIGYIKNGNRLNILQMLRFAGLGIAALSGLLGWHWIFIAIGIVMALPSFALSAARGIGKAYKFIRDSLREMYEVRS